jgi:sec-independent protein translocase protein TatB
MFDFAWSEFAVIAVVALIAIGPKDMPVAIRAMTSWIKKARRMAAEFQGHVDEMVREANLGEVRDQINQIRNFDIKSMVETTVDPDHSLRDTFASNPLDPIVGSGTSGEVASEPVGGAAIAELERQAESGSTVEAADTIQPAIPAFIPPHVAANVTAEDDAEAPAFVPPSLVALARSRGAL